MTRTIDEWLRGIAGTFVLVSVALGWFVHPAYFLITAFVGANLLQSFFTRWCPMMWALQRLGVEPGRSSDEADRGAPTKRSAAGL